MDEDNNQLLVNESINDESAERITLVNDRYNLTYLMFFLCGLSQLLPFNFLITATDFWMLKFQKNNNTETTNLQIYFDTYLTTACNIPLIFIYVLNFFDSYKNISYKWKNIVPFIGVIILFAGITISVVIDTDTFQIGFLIVLLITVFVINIFTAIIQANFAGIASFLPPKCMHLMVTGQATSGLFASVAKIFSLVGNWSLVSGTLACFILANCIIFFTFLLYFYVQSQPYYQRYFKNIRNPDLNVSISLNISSSMMIFKMIWPFCITLLLVFWVSIAVYPSLFVLIKPINEFVPEKLFLPIFCFLVFNLGDVSGRYFGKFFLLKKNQGFLLLVLALIRILFIPLFLFCNVLPRHLSVVFQSEMFFLLFNFVFAFFNGFLVLNAFVNGPLSVPVEFRSNSGFFLVLFLGIGLCLGSLTSNFILRILEV